MPHPLLPVPGLPYTLFFLAPQFRSYLNLATSLGYIQKLHSPKTSPLENLETWSGGSERERLWPKVTQPSMAWYTCESLLRAQCHLTGHQLWYLPTKVSSALQKLPCPLHSPHTAGLLWTEKRLARRANLRHSRCPGTQRTRPARAHTVREEWAGAPAEGQSRHSEDLGRPEFKFSPVVLGKGPHGSGMFFLNYNMGVMASTWS